VSRKRIAILISGRGSNLSALFRADLSGDIVVIGSNKTEAKGLELARDAGIATFVLNHKMFPSREAFDQAMVDELRQHRPDIVVLSGFMRILTPVFVDAFAGRMMNVHPSLLPSYPGLDTHRKAIEDGVKLAGCTVHFVNGELDGGPIILQAAVHVDDDETPETLQTKVLAQENQILPYAVKLFCENRLRIDGKHVRTLPTGSVSQNAV
jgi:phosphoribosylglycinamide formyltransferase 1